MLGSDCVSRLLWLGTRARLVALGARYSVRASAGAEPLGPEAAAGAGGLAAGGSGAAGCCAGGRA